MKGQKIIVRLAFCVIMLGSLGISANHSQAGTADHYMMNNLHY